VRLILNENLAVPDSYHEIEDCFKHSGVEVREFKSPGLHVMHAKTLVVDGQEAFVIGSPFIPDYWDTSDHLINDPRREPEGVRPVHDVSVKLNGGSVRYVEEFFIEMWNYISNEEYQGKGKLHSLSKPLSSGEDPVQIARSITPETLSKKGELGIYEGYRKAIAGANDYIYLENQFFTNRSIIKALKNAMDNKPDLQVIVVMNENPDNPGYKNWQNQCLERLGIKSVEDVLEHSQIGLFTLWSVGWGEDQFKIQPIYVHSKVAIVDDLWATVGTANLDGSSLTHVNELKGFYDAKFQRNMEMNVIIPEMGKKSNDEVEKLRSSLWKEHLGIDNISFTKRPPGGWLDIWQKTAYKNMKSLNHKKPHLNGQILPYSSEKSVESQLKELGIQTKGWMLLK
ncbi:MAG: phosphatidylserine/phosphatidylglycerophosphate/cardiolipin synthase family protein, partial [Methanobacteriaceae archaeon]|nr:phosphatidylserine/phosphatidylglycerophosphate/cardiolipin synthase family protein [Methanobacteriaceae archaeon]